MLFLFAHIIFAVNYHFIQADNDFNDQIARIAFDHSAAAYSKNPQNCLKKYNDSIVVSYGKVRCDHLNNKCHFVLSVSQDYVFVAFRGTASRSQLLVEILETISIPKAKFEAGGSVQHYFLRAFESVWAKISKTIFKLYNKYPAKTFIFTGHSLGGAIASLTSMKFMNEVNNSFTKTQLITYGQPRIGNYEFAMAHDQLVPNSFRIIHRYDLIAHLPYCAERWRNHSCTPFYNHGPYHHRIEIWYPHQMNHTSIYKTCNKNPMNEDGTCSNSQYLHYSRMDHLYYYDKYVSSYGRKGCKASE